MISQASFTLAEDRYFGDTFSWTLAQGQLRFNGDDSLRYFDSFRNQYMTCVKVEQSQLGQFHDVLDLVGAWDWRDAYSPSDVGTVIDDGYEWKFKAEFGDNRCNACGTNAFPSFSDYQVTVASYNTGRYGLLVAAFCDIFRIRIPGYNS